MANVLGTFRAAQEEHLPVAVINDSKHLIRTTWHATRF